MNSPLPFQPSSTPTSTITAAMITAFNNAITTANTVAAGTLLENLSIAQLQTITAAFQTAYDTFAAGIITPPSTSLDAIPNTASTVDGWNNFIVAVNDVAIESDLNIALAYLSRILQNLARAPG